MLTDHAGLSQIERKEIEDAEERIIRKALQYDQSGIKA